MHLECVRSINCLCRWESFRIVTLTHCIHLQHTIQIGRWTVLTDRQTDRKSYAHLIANGLMLFYVLNIDRNGLTLHHHCTTATNTKSQLKCHRLNGQTYLITMKKKYIFQSINVFRLKLCKIAIDLRPELAKPFNLYISIWCMLTLFLNTCDWTIISFFDVVKHLV